MNRIQIPHNLPAPTTSFIGRKHEIAEVRRLMMSTRLLTLTGPGGCGKTRLSIAVAQSLLKTAQFRHGLWFIELADLDSPELIPQVIASALNIPETPDRPLTDALISFLQTRHCLLILDNCEHLLAACADLAQTLLDSGTTVHILATSREPLNLPAELTWLVPSLTLPDALSAAPDNSEAIASEAVALFAARASAALPGFALNTSNTSTIERICRHLDGIPLAIELAAARVKVLDIEQIAARVDDSLQLLTRGHRAAAPRHQTMRAALDWGYRLLSPREQALFRRLAIFAGGFTLDAVETICIDQSPEEFSVRAGDVLDELSDLVDKSLVVIAEREPGEAVRYRLLEPIRQYALDRLREANEEAPTRERHLVHFIDFAEQAEAQLKTQHQLRWLKWLEKDHDNVRTALIWSTRSPKHIASALRLATAMHLFWQRRGYWSEGRRWLTLAITNYDAQPELRSPDLDRQLARALVDRCWLAIYEMDYAHTPPELARALALAAALNDLITTAFAHGLLALVSGYTGNLAASHQHAEASAEFAQQSSDRWTLAWARYIQGWNAFYHRHDEPLAHASLNESERLFRALGDQRSIAVHVNLLGIMALNANDLDTAQVCYTEALTIGRELNDMDLQIKEQSNLAGLALYRGDTSQARQLFAPVLDQLRERDSKSRLADALYGLAVAHMLDGETEAAEALLREALTCIQEQQRRLIHRQILIALGRLIAARGRTLAAARLLGAIEVQLPLDTGHLISDDRMAIERDTAAIRAALPPEEFTAAVRDGRALPLEQAVQELLQPDRASAHPIAPAPIAAPALRLQALGPARVYAADQLITAWPYARVKELLFYLASYPARTKAQIGLDLWPDASPKQLRNSLGITLYHLRRVLGDPQWIVFEDEVYRFNRTLNYQFDVEAFEAQLAHAQRLESQTPERAVILLQAAIELYQGDFVEDLTHGEWFLLRRENLHRKYLDALLRLGRLLFTQRAYAHAAETYRRAIEKDNVQEDAHRELMRCYARLGQRAQALRHYQTFEHILRTELGAPPAPESVALFEQLQRGEEI